MLRRGQVVGIFICCALSCFIFLLGACSTKSRELDKEPESRKYARDKIRVCNEGDGIFCIFQRYLNASKNGSDVLPFFSPHFKENELSDLLTSDDDVTVQNKKVSIRLFYFGMHVADVISHDERCSSRGCQLAVIFESTEDDRVRLLLIDYIKPNSSDNYLINSITIDSREKSKRPASPFRDE